MIAIKEHCISKSNFNFLFVKTADILKEYKTLQSNKATQNSGIPTKLAKDNADIFVEVVFNNLNKCIEQPVLPSKLKLSNTSPVHQKKIKKLKRQLQTCKYFIKYL